MLTSREQIDFNPPSSQNGGTRDLSLNLYLYDVRASKKMPVSGRQVERRFDRSHPVADIRRASSWFDVSILITARDRTIFGEHRLLAEVLSLLMRNQSIREEFLTPVRWKVIPMVHCWRLLPPFIVESKPSITSCIYR